MAKAANGSNVAVLGASPREERFSFKAVRLLKQNGHQPIPIHPAGHTVDGVPGLKSLSDITDPIDTVTVYVSSKISDGELDNILKVNPRRVVFNPGAENEELASKLEVSGMEVVRHCTLIMLHEGLF